MIAHKQGFPIHFHRFNCVPLFLSFFPLSPQASTSPTVDDRSCAGSEALRGSVGVASTEIAKNIYAPRDLVRNDNERDAAVLTVAPVQGCQPSLPFSL